MNKKEQWGCGLLPKNTIEQNLISYSQISIISRALS